MYLLVAKLLYNMKHTPVCLSDMSAMFRGTHDFSRLPFKDRGLIYTVILSSTYVHLYFIFISFSTLPCCALGAQIPPPLFLIFHYFRILDPAGGVTTAGP